MALQLPKDIVAVDSSERTYLFYVNQGGKLSYLISPDADGDKSYNWKRVEIDGDDISVKPDTQQVAAIAWEADGVSQIRVYYVTTDGNLSEVCHSSNQEGWYQGSLGAPDTVSHPIATGSSISATIARRPGSLSLRVFASGRDQKNQFGNPNIGVFRFDYDSKARATGQWGQSPISNSLRKW